MQEENAQNKKADVNETMSQLSVYMQETIHGLALDENSAEDINQFAKNYTEQEKQCNKG